MEKLKIMKTKILIIILGLFCITLFISSKRTCSITSFNENYYSRIQLLEKSQIGGDNLFLVKVDNKEYLVYGRGGIVKHE